MDEKIFAHEMPMSSSLPWLPLFPLNTVLFPGGTLPLRVFEPRYVDMVNWGATYQVQFPFAVDPGFKSGVYFDRAATPMNMLVDARTMKILVLVTGYSPTLYDTASEILTQRGR